MVQIRSVSWVKDAHPEYHVAKAKLDIIMNCLRSQYMLHYGEQLIPSHYYLNKLKFYIQI